MSEIPLERRSSETFSREMQNCPKIRSTMNHIPSRISSAKPQHIYDTQLEYIYGTPNFTTKIHL